MRACFPLPDDIRRHDLRVRILVTWFTVQMALSDTESIGYVPTQYVQNSQRLFSFSEAAILSTQSAHAFRAT